MRHISLSQGKFALIDDRDFECVNQFNWFAMKTKQGDCKAARRGDRRKGEKETVYMHRFILNAKDGELVDHKNGHGLNNLRSNIRICTKSDNGKNRHVTKSSTGFRGVYRQGKSQIIARIMSNGESIYLGSFRNIKEAVSARDKATIKYHKEFASLNL